MKHRSRYQTDPHIAPVLPAFLGRLAQHVLTIQQLQQANDTTELKKLLHQLKGAGKSYGYDEISTHAAAADAALPNAPELAAGHTRALLAYIQDIEGFTPITPAAKPGD